MVRFECTEDSSLPSATDCKQVSMKQASAAVLVASLALVVAVIASFGVIHLRKNTD